MDIKSAAAQLGKLGGKKTAERHDSEHYRKMQAKGVQARKANKKNLEKTAT